MDKLLTTVVLFGKLALCYPLVHSGKCQRFQIGRLGVNAGKLLQLALAILLAIAYTVPVSKAVRWFHRENPSDSVINAVNVTSVFVPMILLRSAVFLYWNDLVFTSASLHFLLRQSAFVQLRSSSARTKANCAVAWLVPPLLLSNFVVASYMLSSIDFDYVSKTVYALDCVAISFAILFVVCYGSILVDLYDSQLKQFRQEFLSGCLCESKNEFLVLNLQGPEESTVEQNLERLSAFKFEFGKLQQCWSVYSKVAGFYSLAVFIRSTFQIIFMVLGLAGSRLVDRAFLIVYAPHLVSVIILAEMGNFVQKQVC